MRRRKPDFVSRFEGSITLLTAQTRAARDWAAEHLPDDCPTFGRAFAIESNCFPPIADGITANGLSIA